MVLYLLQIHTIYRHVGVVQHPKVINLHPLTPYWIYSAAVIFY